MFRAERGERIIIARDGKPVGTARSLTPALHAQAVVLAREFQLSFYDALIIAAAQDAGCELLCSEDLKDGQKFGKVTVENPFRR